MYIKSGWTIHKELTRKTNYRVENKKGLPNTKMLKLEHMLKSFKNEIQ